MPALTGLRFVAAFGVLLFHYGAGFTDRSHFPKIITHILHNGYLGVSLFFVLSGYILMHTYQYRTVDMRFLSDFAVARLARLYPVYLFALIVMLPVLTTALTPAVAIKVLLMVQSWTSPKSSAGLAWVMQAWTLSVELLFYLLFPIFLVGIRRLRSIPALFVASIMAAIILAFGTSSITPSSAPIPYLPMQYAPIIPLCRLPEFIFGAALCRVQSTMSKLTPGPALWVLEIGIVIASLSVLATATEVHTLAVATVLFGPLIVMLSVGSGPLAGALSSDTMTLLGGASYSLYLLQAPVREICRHLVCHPWDEIIYPVIAISAAIGVFLLWEQPSRRIILALYKKWPPRALFSEGQTRDAARLRLKNVDIENTQR